MSTPFPYVGVVAREAALREQFPLIVDWAGCKIILAKSLINVILTNLSSVRFAHNWNTGMLEKWNIGFLFELIIKK